MPSFMRQKVAISDGSAVDVLRWGESGTKPGITFLAGIYTEGMKKQGKRPDGHSATIGRALLENAQKAGVPFTYIDWRSPPEGMPTQWRRNLLEAFNKVSPPGSPPQVAVGHCFGGWYAALLAQDLEDAGRIEALSGMALIGPSFNGMRLAAKLVGDVTVAALCADPALTVGVPLKYSIPVSHARIADGEKHLVGTESPRPPARVPTHIFHYLEGKDHVPIGVSRDYAAAAGSHVVIEEVRRDRDLLGRAFQPRVWNVARAMLAAG